MLLLVGLLGFLVAAVLGDSRELIPQDAPTNLTLLEIKGRQVLIEWDPIDPYSIRGNFKGYLVRTWNNEGSQVYAFPPDITKVYVEFFPFSKNFITVSARNEKYVGPPSEAISFDAPQIEPNVPYVLDVFTLSEKSVLLRWSKPTQVNGVLLGYKIYCILLNDTSPEVSIRESVHQIFDPDKLQAKLTGMSEGLRYKIGVSALNCAGESEIKIAEISLDGHSPGEPFSPKFLYKVNYTTPKREEVCYNKAPVVSPVEEEIAKEVDYYDYLILNESKKIRKGDKEVSGATPKTVSRGNDYEKSCMVDCMVMWLPDVHNNPGEYFYVKYKVKGEEDYQISEPEMSEDFIILYKFDSCKNYEIVVTAVDGEFSTDSAPVLTPSKPQF